MGLGYKALRLCFVYQTSSVRHQIWTSFSYDKISSQAINQHNDYLAKRWTDWWRQFNVEISSIFFCFVQVHGSLEEVLPKALGVVILPLPVVTCSRWLTGEVPESGMSRNSSLQGKNPLRKIAKPKNSPKTQVMRMNVLPLMTMFDEQLGFGWMQTMVHCEMIKEQ